MATTRFPVVFEPEDSGVISAYVAGLPVYAQGTTRAQARRAIRRTLMAYLEAHPEADCAAEVQVATVLRRRHAAPTVALKSAAALVGSRTSARKAEASRANGRLGGRPALATRSR